MVQSQVTVRLLRRSCDYQKTESISKYMDSRHRNSKAASGSIRNQPARNRNHCTDNTRNCYLIETFSK